MLHKPDRPIPEEMAHQYSLPIRGSSSKPKAYMSGVAVQNTAEPVKEPTPDQAIPKNGAQAPQRIIDLSHDQKAMDTIIVCSLLSEPFGVPMSNAEIAEAINIRDGRKDSPIGANTVDHNLQFAPSPFTQKHFPETCRYKKWEAVRNKNPKPIWVGNGEDKEIEEAFTLWSETLRFVRPELFSEQGFNVFRPQRQS